MYNPQNLTELYSDDDIESLFKGGFINFGYWDKEILDKKQIDEVDAIAANRRLAHEVFKYLDIAEDNDILEAGSGFGSASALLAQTYNLASVTGLEYFEKHVEIARTRNKDLIADNKLNFIKGKAEDIPFPDNKFSRIFSIEAFQHFNVKSSISEFERVLKPQGRLVLATFFAKDKANFAEILKLLPRAAVISDNDNESNSAFPEVLNTLESHSFCDINVIPIGKYVWYGYDKWVRQREPGIWDINWFVAYEKGLLDYYIINAKL